MSQHIILVTFMVVRGLPPFQASQLDRKTSTNKKETESSSLLFWRAEENISTCLPSAPPLHLPGHGRGHTHPKVHCWQGKTGLLQLTTHTSPLNWKQRHLPWPNWSFVSRQERRRAKGRQLTAPGQSSPPSTGTLRGSTLCGCQESLQAERPWKRRALGLESSMGFSSGSSWGLS